MGTRRSVLAAGAAGALAAVAGCTDTLGLAGGGGSRPSDAVEWSKSFLADPSLSTDVDAVQEPHHTDCLLQHYDGSLADHADRLDVDTDLSTYGLWPLRLGEESVEAVESIGAVTLGSYTTTWEHDDPEGELPRSGQARGGMASFRGDYDRDVLETALELDGSPTGSTDGYDLYTDGGSLAWGLAEDGILNAGLTNLYVPGVDVEAANRAAATKALLERSADRSTSAAAPPEWVGDVLDAVGTAHHLTASYTTVPAEETQIASARSFHVDGEGTTVTLAEGAPDAASFETERWTDGSIERTLLGQVASLAGFSSRDLDVARDRLLEEPTVDLGDRRGVVSAVMASEALDDPYLE